MQKKLHYKGVWFLPNSEHQYTGLLDFSPNKGATLELLGLFGKENEDGHRPAIILGVTSDGKKITLYKCFRTNRGFHSNGIETSIYDAIFLFIGGHFLNPDELWFTQIEFQFKSFDYWLGIYGFSRIEYIKETKEFFVEYKQPADLVFHLPEELKCGFQFSTYTSNSSKSSKAMVKQVCEISLFHTSKSLTRFEELFSMFETFENFLTLAYFGKPLIKKLFLKTKVLTKKNEEYYKTIEIHFQTPSLKGKFHKRNNSNYFLFTYKIIQENFQEILSKWYKAKTKLEPSINGLAEAFSVREQVTEFKFLNLAHALETYHQRKEKENLGKASQTLLQKRLEALSSLIPKEIKFLLFKPSEKEFIENIKNSRNYYTHYSEEKEAKALKGSDLFHLSERMKIFLICIVLKEIGFTNDEVVKTILRKGVFLFNHIIKYDEAKQYFHDW